MPAFECLAVVPPTPVRIMLIGRYSSFRLLSDKTCTKCVARIFYNEAHEIQEVRESVVPLVTQAPPALVFGPTLALNAEYRPQ